MRTLTSILLMLLHLAMAYGQPSDTEAMLHGLDTVLANAGYHTNAKEARICQLRKKDSELLKDEERLWFNKMMYDEYAVYKADSAMRYVEANIGLARRMGRTSTEQEWRINKAFLLAAQGLLSESEKELAQADVASMDDDVISAYYETGIYLYSHLAQYIGHSNRLYEEYDRTAGSLRRKALEHTSPSHPTYCGLMAATLSSPSEMEWKKVKERLRSSVEESQLSSRQDAINAYRLAKMYLAEGDDKRHMEYLAKSAIADIRMCNHDIASLEELSNILYQRGDIDRGYAYISYCLKAAIRYPNRVRTFNISALTDKLQQASEQRSRNHEHELAYFLLALGILSAVLCAVMVVILVLFLKLRRANAKQLEDKALLKQRMAELHKAQLSLSDMNKELTDTVEMLRQSNEKLEESNYVKEEYVGYVFSICSNYLTKIEEYRKNIARKLKVGKVEDIRTLVLNPQISQKDMHEFYHHFDTVFLHLYPTFVEDFNKLLQPEERIVLKNDEALNTDLRIYAIIRLGINDSVKISELLHISTQTVYNNRLKIRNKAIVPKEQFVEHVRQIGITGRVETRKDAEPSV